MPTKGRLSQGVELARVKLQLANMRQQNAAYRRQLRRLQERAEFWRRTARSLGARVISTRKFDLEPHRPTWRQRR